MNEQRFFDASLTHIRNQGKPSMGENMSCMYATASGLGCAFAPAIMEYDPAQEGSAAYEYPLHLLHSWARELDSDLVSDVQSAHDLSSSLTATEFLPSFERKMKDAAHNYNRNIIDSTLIVRYRPPA